MNRIMMHVGGEHRPLAMGGTFTAPPALDGGSAWWAGLPVEQHRMQPWEGDAEIGPLGDEQGVLVYTSGSAEILATQRGVDVSRKAGVGSVRVLSGNDRARFRRIRGHAEVIAVHLPTEWITRALGEKGIDAFSKTVSLDRDETVISLARELSTEVSRRGQNGRLFAESLSIAFVSYIGARLEERSPVPHAKARAFSREESARLREFISSRLGEDLSLTEMASVVGLRPRHFSALFHRAFGCSPYRFVLNRRLSEAARLLDTTSHDVAEVAYELGFCSQSHFTALFRRAYGVTPGQYVTRRRSSVS